VESIENWRFVVLHGTWGLCNWWEFRRHIGGPFARVWETRLLDLPEINKWYRVEIVDMENLISLYIDGELKHQIDDQLHPSGGVFLFAYDGITEFDNVVITGNSIPDIDFAVQPKPKLTTTWGQLKK